VTGSEPLLDETVDTNSCMMAGMLRDIGLDLYHKTTVGDNRDRLAAVVSLALERSDIVLVLGGLGPTVDDVTREAVFTKHRQAYAPLISPMISSNGLHSFFTVLCYHGGRIVDGRNPDDGVNEASLGLTILER